MSSAILIAESLPSRARQLADACAARGYATSCVRTGAAALEAALADVPDVLVAPVDLELIDAGTLAKILRANPRTQGVRFLFLGDDPINGGFFDDALPPSASAEDVALRIEAILAQRERIDAVEREAEAQQEVQGKLAQIPLTDLLQLFHMNRRTGTIELAREEGGHQDEQGALILRDGNLVQATAGRVEGEKALFRMLSWREGRFAFTPGTVTMAPRITTPTRALLMEALRQLDEWDQLRESLPPTSARVSLAVPREELPSALHPVTQELLGLLERDERVGDLLDRTSFPDYQVLRTLQTLCERGLVQLRREAEQGEAGSLEGLFDTAQKRRLREWLQAGRPRGSAAKEAKLLLAAADPAGTRDFVRVLAALPGVRMEPGGSGEYRPEDVAVLGRIEVGEGLMVQLLQVPSDPRYAACWPALTHGALGTLLLMRWPHHEDEERLRPLVEQIRSRGPEARVFHVIVLPKGEKLARAELEPSLGLLDQASVFLLPLEGERDPVALLGTMLGRVLP